MSADPPPLHVVPNERPVPPYRPTLFDRLGPDAGLVIRAFAYGGLVFGMSGSSPNLSKVDTTMATSATPYRSGTERELSGMDGAVKGALEGRRAEELWEGDNGFAESLITSGSNARPIDGRAGGELSPRSDDMHSLSRGPCRAAPGTEAHRVTADTRRFLRSSTQRFADRQAVTQKVAMIIPARTSVGQ